MNGSKWDNKRGWSIPRYVIDSMQLTFFLCVATLEGKDYYSATYILHTAGENTLQTICDYSKGLKRSSLSMKSSRFAKNQRM